MHKFIRKLSPFINPSAFGLRLDLFTTSIEPLKTILPMHIWLKHLHHLHQFLEGNDHISANSAPQILFLLPILFSCWKRIDHTC